MAPRFLVTGLAAGVLAALAACGSVQEAPQANPSAPAAAEGAFPVTVEHKFGKSVIESAPARVVVVGTATDDLDAAIALGVTPVAFFTKSGSDAVPSWLRGKLDPAATKIVNAASGVDPEQVGSFTPDLILATSSYGLEDEYANLAKVAPTIGYATEWGAQTWQEHVEVVAKALGRQAQAKTVIETTQAAIDKIKAEFPAAAGKTFTASVGNAPGKVFTLVSQQDFAVQLIQQLGLGLAPEVADATKDEAGSPTGTLSPEQYDKLAADLVVIAFTSPDLRQEFEGNKLVAGVTAGNYLVVDMETISALRYPTALDIPWVLEKLKPGLAKLA